MKNEFLFDIESLLFGLENPKGAIEQVLFAKRLAEHEGMNSFNRLALITFSDPKINKAVIGAVPLDETLLVGFEGWNDAELHLCIRAGKSTCKIATGHFPSREITIHGDYRQAIIMRKLSDKEINQVFARIWENFELIQPKPRINNFDDY